MLQLGNVSVGQVFIYKQGLFVVLPFNWELEKYSNLCIARRKSEDFDFDFEVGEEYVLDEKIEVEIVSVLELQKFISKI